MNKRCILLLLTVLLLASGIAALAEAPESSAWQGHTLTPRYYSLFYNGRIRVRVSCDAVPLAALTRGMKDFVLPGADGGADTAAEGIVVLGEYLYGSPEGETEFFDIVFETKQKSGDLQVRLGTDGPVLSVPLIDDHRELSGFRTESGAYVLSFYTEDDPERMGPQYADLFNGQDVTLYIEDAIDQTGIFYDISDFLQQFRFASLRLFTSAVVDKSYDAGCVTELGLTKILNSLPMFPQVKKLTLYQDAAFPDNLAEAFPALEEMTLMLLPPYAGRNLLTYGSSRPAKVVPSLKALHVSLSFGELPTDDPGFRVWLAAQRTAAPDLTVNGMPAQALDLADGLSEDDQEKIRRAADDQTIMNLYGLVGQEVSWAREARPAHVVAAVIDRYGRIEAVSTDRKTDYDFAGMLSGHLAASLEEADAIAIIYPVLRDAGKYGGSFTAYSCETRLAVIDRQSGQVLLDQSVILRQPPQSIRLGSGQNAGAFEAALALRALAEALQ